MAALEKAVERSGGLPGGGLDKPLDKEEEVREDMVPGVESVGVTIFSYLIFSTYLIFGASLI